MDIKQLNEELSKLLESNLPDISKMDKICDLDKHYSESGRYIGRRNSKWNIYKYVRTSRKFNGGYNYDYKAISPDFDTYDEAIEWFAKDLLSNNSEEDLYDCIKEGSFVIYDDKLNAQLGTTNIEKGKLDTSLKFPSGENKGIDPLPQYMLEPNKAKANNLRREYVQAHGKPYNEGKLREDVIFKDDNITLSDKEIKELEKTVAEGTLSGEINGHKWRMEVRFSSGKNLEDVSPAIQRYIYDLVSLNVSHYSFAETIVIVADDYDDYVITKEDLESVTKYLKDADTENPYITVDVLTRMYWG